MVSGKLKKNPIKNTFRSSQHAHSADRGCLGARAMGGRTVRVARQGRAGRVDRTVREGLRGVREGCGSLGGGWPGQAGRPYSLPACLSFF